MSLMKYNKGTQAYRKVPPPYDLKATHYKIGDDKPVYETTQKTDFEWKDPDANQGQNKGLMKDLRGRLQIIAQRTISHSVTIQTFTNQRARLSTKRSSLTRMEPRRWIPTRTATRSEMELRDSLSTTSVCTTKR